MKIIHCLNYFLPENIAGTEMYVYNLAKKLTEAGTDVVVVIPNYGKKITEEYFFDCIKVIRYAEPSIPDRALIMGRRDPDGLAFFAEVLRAEKPDIVHFHELAGSNGITLRHVETARSAGIKNVMTFHLSGYSCKTGHLMYKDREICDGIIRPGRCSDCYKSVRLKNSWYTFPILPVSLLLYRAGIDTSNWNSKIGTAFGFPFLIKKLKADLLKLEQNCDALVTLTKWYKEILEKNDVHSEKITHIPQGLTVQKAPVAKPFTADHRFLKIIFVGRISRFKGLHLLVEALTKIEAGKVSLDIYGADSDDAYSAELKKITATMPDVHWKGILEPGTVSAVMADHDLLCLPSEFSEMSPLVIPEAFAAGIPVLASDVYGNAEQIKDNINGWLFRFKDAADLAAKISMIAKDRALITEATKNIPQTRSFSMVADEQMAVYKKIMSV